LRVSLYLSALIFIAVRNGIAAAPLTAIALLSEIC